MNLQLYHHKPTEQIEGKINKYKSQTFGHQDHFWFGDSPNCARKINQSDSKKSDLIMELERGQRSPRVMKI